VKRERGGGGGGGFEQKVGGRGGGGGGGQQRVNPGQQKGVSAKNSIDSSTKGEVDALGVITISRGCFERCCSNKKTPPYHSNLNFVALRTRRPTLLRAPACRTPSEASPRRRCGHASRFLWTRPPLLGSRSAFASSLCLCAGSAFAQAVASVG